MSAPAMGHKGHNGAQKAPQTLQNGVQVPHAGH